MASKKKLRKQIRDLEIRLAGSQAREHSLKLDIHTLIEGKDVARIQQIKIRSNIEYEFNENVWFGNRFFHQIKEQVADVHGERFKYEELDKRFCQPTQVNPEKDGYSMLNKDIESPKIEKRGPIIEMLPKTQKEIEADAYMNKDFIGGYNPNAKKTST